MIWKLESGRPKSGVRVEIGGPPSQRGGEVEAKAVDVHLLPHGR
jgi:hypothetical protein